jgi:hypothetical protein
MLLLNIYIDIFFNQVKMGILFECGYLDDENQLLYNSLTDTSVILTNTLGYSIDFLSETNRFKNSIKSFYDESTPDIQTFMRDTPYSDYLLEMPEYSHED